MANKSSPRRRTPEQARAEILAAATDLMQRYGPDGVSLRQVAEAAGVTHGLVTHYFGTYRALVRAVLLRAEEERRARIRERMQAGEGVPYAVDVTTVLFDSLSDPRHVRLWAWSMLDPERPDDAAEGLAAFVDTLEEGIRLVLAGPRMPDRARIEQTVLLALSVSYGYALGRRRWLSGLGRDPDDPAADAAFRAVVAAAVATQWPADGPSGSVNRPPTAGPPR